MAEEKTKSDKYAGLRAKAEAKLKKQIVKLREQSHSNTDKVIHELEVHQIELQMQSEELRRTQQELEQSRARYSDLYDFAPVGYFTFDKRGLVIEANLTGCQMLGIERGNLIKKPFHIFVSRENQDEFYKHRRHTLTPGLKQTCEITLVRKDGDTFEAQLESVPVENAGGDITLCRTVIIDITDRKRIERLMNEVRMEIVKEKNRLEAVMDAMPIGISIIDDKGGAIRSNRAFEEIWGGPRPVAGCIKDYAKYKAWWADTGKQLKPQDWASAQAIQQGKTVTGQMLEIERFDGSRAYVLNSAAPVFSAGGKIAGSAVAILDITKQKKAEQAVLLEKESYQTLAQNLPGLVYRVHLGDHRQMEFFNQSLAALTGYTEAELTVGEVCSIVPLIVSEDRAEVIMEVQQAIKEHRPFELEYRLRTKTGDLRHFSERGQPIYAADGSCSHLDGVIFDITKRKQTEEALRQSEERLRALAEAMPQIVWTADADGGIEWFNRRWYEYTGQPQGIGECWSWDKVTHPDDMAQTLKNWKDALQRGGLFQNEIRVLRHDGQYHWFLVRAWPMTDTRGKVIRWFGTNTDIDELKQAEEAIRRSNEELSRFNNAAVGRELRMIELKKEVNNLCKQSGQPPRYPLDFEKDDYNEKKEIAVK